MTKRLTPILLAVILSITAACAAHAQDISGFQSPSKNIACIYFEFDGHKRFVAMSATRYGGWDQNPRIASRTGAIRSRWTRRAPRGLAAPGIRRSANRCGFCPMARSGSAAASPASRKNQGSPASTPTATGFRCREPGKRCFEGDQLSPPFLARRHAPHFYAGFGSSTMTLSAPQK